MVAGFDGDDGWGMLREFAVVDEDAGAGGIALDGQFHGGGAAGEEQGRDQDHEQPAAESVHPGSSLIGAGVSVVFINYRYRLEVSNGRWQGDGRSDFSRD